MSTASDECAGENRVTKAKALTKAPGQADELEFLLRTGTLVLHAVAPTCTTGRSTRRPNDNNDGLYTDRERYMYVELYVRGIMLPVNECLESIENCNTDTCT